MTNVKVKVLRPQRGDKLYVRGDVRMLSKDDAERLAATGAVEIVKSVAKRVSAKKAPAAKNKMAAKPANKARG